MKDSKEKEHRISNLKNMISNIKEDDPKSFEGIEEDSELINYLNEEQAEFEELEIDDEFIYRPGDEDSNAVNLEEDQIDEDFIIKTPKTEDAEEGSVIHEVDEFGDDLVGEISENFDNVINAKIGGKPILAIASAILGVAFLIISVFIFQSRSDRVIDNVVAGETSFMFIIFLVIGFLLLFYGAYQLLNLDNPFEKITSNIDNIEKDDKDDDENTKTEKPSPKVIPKSEIPLDKESYKIGEFDLDELKSSLKKPTDSKNKPKQKEDIPHAKGKSPKKKELTAEEIEYEQVKLDTESIDDIFAEVEDLDDLEIISIDSEKEE